MSGKIILPFGQSNEPLAKLVTHAVKQRYGKNQAFVIAVIQDDGTAAVATNMNSHPQIVELMAEVLMSVKGN